MLADLRCTEGKNRLVFGITKVQSCRESGHGF